MIKTYDDSSNYYPRVTANLKKLQENAEEIKRLCEENGISLAAVIKGFTGIPECVMAISKANCQYIASSRLEQITDAIEFGIPGPFMLLRLPQLCDVDEVVSLCEISLNSELPALIALNEAAKEQSKIHKVILMADLGDLREGFWDRDELADAAAFVEFDLDNLYLAGVGTNVGCYGSIKPTAEKLTELVDCAEKIEAKINRKLDIISGGASTSLIRLIDGDMPDRINHLRVGEAIFNAKDNQDLYGCNTEFLHRDVFTLKAQVIEVKVKPTHPVGEILFDAYGMKQEYIDRGMRKRALLALGKVDFAFTDMIYPRDEGVEIIGASSDHTIIDVEDAKHDFKVGDIMEFDLSYASSVYVTNSPNVRVVIE